MGAGRFRHPAKLKSLGRELSTSAKRTEARYVTLIVSQAQHDANTSFHSTHVWKSMRIQSTVVTLLLTCASRELSVLIAPRTTPQSLLIGDWQMLEQ